jgi:hypothetical protein
VGPGKERSTYNLFAPQHRGRKAEIVKHSTSYVIYANEGFVVARLRSIVIVIMLCLGPLLLSMNLFPTNYHGYGSGPGEEPTVVVEEPGPLEPLCDLEGFFTENLGQKGEGAGMFYCQGSPLSVSFGESWVAYDYRPDGTAHGAMFRARFDGANPVQPRGVDPLVHKSSFFLGDDPEGWVTGAGNYRRVVFTDLYEGIDLMYRIEAGRLKYDFIVHPRADPSCITISYEGVERCHVEPSTGDLLILTPVGTVRDEAPTTFQVLPGGRSIVKSGYQLLDDLTLGFAIEGYDHNLPLVIDPGLEFCTYFGGSNTEHGGGVAVDEAGDIYVGGNTGSMDFNITPGAYGIKNDTSIDVFVMKMNHNATELIYSALISGSSSDYGQCIVVDDFGCAYVGGTTYSNDFPTTSDVVQNTSAGGHEGYILKMSPKGDEYLCRWNGSRIWTRHRDRPDLRLLVRLRRFPRRVLSHYP